MKVAIYCRLSEEDRNKQFETDDSNSIQNQKAMLLQYAMEQGWELYNIYSDDDYTGADRRRPEFNRLLVDAEAKRFDIILCKTQSRFTRELELVEKYIHGLFPVWGIRFVSISPDQRACQRMVLRGYVRQHPKRLDKQTAERLSYRCFCTLRVQERPGAQGTFNYR